MLVLPYLHYVPRLGAGLQAHASAAVIGRTVIGNRCTLEALAVLRADGHDITVGDDCWFAQASTVHIAGGRMGTLMGARVTVGRYGLVHGCTLGDDCVIGEHSAVMDGSSIGPGAVLAADSVVPPGKTLEGGWLYEGAPARPVARVSAAQLAHLHEVIRAGAATHGTCVSATEPLAPLRHAPGTGLARDFGPGVYVAPTASIVGQVTFAPLTSVWFSTEIDAGQASVEIGEGSNVQDNSRLYAGAAGEDLRIGKLVLIGHNVRIFASTIEDEAIIGMGATVSPGTVVRRGGCVAAGSVTEPGSVIASGEVWSGRPARPTRALSETNRAGFSMGVRAYIGYAGEYLATAAAR